MEIEDFCNEVVKLILGQEDVKFDFRTRLRTRLKKYYELVNSLDLISLEDLKIIKFICDKLNEIVRNSFKGLQSTAFNQLKNLIQGKKGLEPKINLIKNLITISENTSFYRIRTFSSIYHVSAKDLFHIPLDMRGIVTTQRFSTPGYPCLYLGKSIYGCWEEMRRPLMFNCAVSRFVNQKNINFINLALPTVDKVQEDKDEYLKVLPLVIACMIPVSRDSDTFKPEYIIPQLLIEWILKNRNFKGKIIHGVAYTSTQRNGEFDFPDDKFINYAIPVFKVKDKVRYCQTLCELFKLTDPTTNDIEKLKCGYSIDCGSAAPSKTENYNVSDFGNLEIRLEDENEFPLMKIEYK